MDEQEVWSDNNESDSLGIDESPPPIEDNLQGSDKHLHSLVKWLIGFFLLLQAQFSLSQRIVDLIFRFLKVYFTVLGRFYEPLAVIAAQLPSTNFMAHKMYTKREAMEFQIYAVCKLCGTVWKAKECTEGPSTNKRAKLCSHKPPFTRRVNQACGGSLLKTVELASKCKVFYPLMTYCYVDLHTSLQHLLLNKSFVENCNHWKSREIPDSDLKDVYDGRVWKKFIKYDGLPFLEESYSYGFMLNLDWFQPYKHLQYSVGVIYLSVLNLPPNVRYKFQNICLIGIIPGPREPENSVNEYIKPLVNDLLQFWNGVELNVCTTTTVQRRKVRCALLCCSCDLPAGRKLCGFMGHSAHMGCSKCKKYFPSIESEKKLDFSGFQRNEWTPRTNAGHRSDVLELEKCQSKTELAQKESQFGCRYSRLLDLPYFDPPTMLVIDPMHNLFLGLAKHFTKKIFLKGTILSKEDLKIIQDRINRIVIPSDIGRIPYKISDSYRSFTADQYKNWVIHYSIICLYGLLSAANIECWRHLVLACRILCKFRLTHDDVIIADALILRFCKRTEELFGKHLITPNMHMSCHIRECILDYGPMQNFWLFSFERYNGILGRLPNNNRSIEVQMMRRFLSDADTAKVALPNDYVDDFNELIQFSRSYVGTLGQNELRCTTDNMEFPHHYTRCVLSANEMQDLYSRFGYEESASKYISPVYQKYSTITINGKVYGGCTSRAKTSSIVMIEINNETRPAKIYFFAKVAAVIECLPKTHTLVYLSCYKHHTDKEKCGKPVTIWESDFFEPSQFLDVSAIKFRTASLVEKLNDEYGNVLFVSPYD